MKIYPVSLLSIDSNLLESKSNSTEVAARVEAYSGNVKLEK